MFSKFYFHFIPIGQTGTEAPQWIVSGNPESQILLAASNACYADIAFLQQSSIDL